MYVYFLCFLSIGAFVFIVRISMKMLIHMHHFDAGFCLHYVINSFSCMHHLLLLDTITACINLLIRSDLSYNKLHLNSRIWNLK